jgi:hypothetical protein
MSDAPAQTTIHADIERALASLDAFGIEVYVHVGKPGGHYSGADILFRVRADADLRFPSMTLLRAVMDRFTADKAYRDALSFRCFQVGAFVQNWSEPAPVLNFGDAA